MIESKFWVGVVEDRNDPLRLGRCRVRVFGVHTENTQELPTDKLNWAHPVFPLNNPNGYSPKEGDTVVGFFMDGEEAQFPMMLGITPKIPPGRANTAFGFNDLRTDQKLQSAPKKPDEFGEGTGRYPRVIDEPTTPRIARNENIANSQFQIKRNKVIQGSGEVVKAPKTIYPYNNVYESESGHALEFDDTPDQERIHLFHRNGSYLEMLPDGTFNQKTEKNKADVTRGKSQIYVGEDLTVTVKGDVTYVVDGNFTVACDGDFTVAAGGSGSISAGSKISVSAGATSSFSSKGYTSISALGYLSMSALGYASLSAWGPLKLSSKVLASLGAPICKIGIIGAIGAEGAQEAAGSAASQAAQAAASTAASNMVNGFSLVSPTGFSAAFESFGADVLGNFSTLADTTQGALGGILENTQGFFSSLGSEIVSAVGSFTDQVGTAFNNAIDGIQGAFDGLNFDSFSGFTDSLEGFQTSIGEAVGQFSGVIDTVETVSGIASTVSGVLVDPLDSLLNGQPIQALDTALQGIGVNVNNLTNAPIIRETVDLLGQARDALGLGQQLLASGNPIQALGALSQAADIAGNSQFLGNLGDTISSVTNSFRQSTIATTFNDIRNATTQGLDAISQVSAGITDTYNTFVDAAGLDFLGRMPSVNGLTNVVSRVSEAMRSNTEIRDNVSGIMIDSIAAGDTQQQTEEKITSYLQTAFSENVEQELAASPITLLNVAQSTTNGVA